MAFSCADLFFDQIEVVEQPFPGRSDPPVRSNGIREQTVDSNQDIFILRQSRKKRVRIPFGA